MRLIFLFLLVFSIVASAQKKKNVVVGDRGAIAYEQGKAAYDKDNYKEAIPFFEEALKNDSKNEDAICYLGLSFRYTNQNQQAIDQFELLKKINSNYWAWFYYEAGMAY